MRSLKLCVLFVFVVIALALFGGRGLEHAFAFKSSNVVLAAPTGVDATDSQYATKVGLHWNTVRDATVYRIFRNIDANPSTAQEIGSTSANYFFDTTAVTSQVYLYWVKAENAQTSSGFSTADQGTRGVGKIVGTQFGALEPPPVPAGNPVTASKAYLGKALFWDEQLSSTKTVACGTCHRPEHGGADPRTSSADLSTRNPGFDNAFGTADDIFGSRGLPRNAADGTYDPSTIFGFADQVTNRRAPSYLNAAYAQNGLFWDGRATPTFRDPITNAIILNTGASLESQVLGPPVSPVEMGHNTRDWNGVAARVAASRPLALAGNIPTGLAEWIEGRTYPELFQEVFGTPDVTPSRIAMAIATHERTLFSDQTPLDRSEMQMEPLSDPESIGRDLFVELRCSFCHSGPLLSENRYHNIGVRPQVEDSGRGGVTGNSNNNGEFKTPTLRNVELHGPYMHNGRFNTLEEVVDFYDRGGDHNAANIDRSLIRPLGLTADDKAALVAFLKRPLTDPRVRDELPPFDRPQLYTESNRVPVLSGTGRAGSGTLTPDAVAIEPPLLGNPNFTVAVRRGVGNAEAVVVIDSADPGIGSSIPAAGSFARRSTTLSGVGNGNGSGSVNLAIPNDPSLVGRTFYGRWYITDASAANGFSVSQLFRFTIFGTGGTVAARRSPFDFDGDGKTDIGIYRPGPGEWWYSRSGDAQVVAFQFGVSADAIAPADFTGDGKADVAFFRPSTGEWFILRSEDNSYFAFPFGQNGDVPVPADYDGDGKADIAVFRPSGSTWFILQSSGGTRINSFGVAGDVPAVADYDGDQRADIAVYRPAAGEWWIERSTAGLLSMQFGTQTDKPVQGDYTGDGKSDVAFWRPATGNWYIVRSEDYSFLAFPFGSNGDVPAPGDYDGDGRTDAAVFRPAGSTWFLQGSTAGTQITQFGSTGDRPIPNAFVR